jgi:hypothetical protein
VRARTGKALNSGPRAGRGVVLQPFEQALAHLLALGAQFAAFAVGQITSTVPVWVQSGEGCRNT